MSRTPKFLAASSTVALMIALSGCGDASTSATRRTGADGHGHDHGAGGDHGHDHGAAGHAHADAKTGTPHGGTPVQVGDHGFHLEIVPDPVEGKMLAYVLDAHAERGVSVSGAPFELVAKAGGQEHRFTFHPVTNANASGGKTSVFSATTTNLNSLTNFEGVIPKITLDGKTFGNVTFSYPKGSRHEH